MLMIGEPIKAKSFNPGMTINSSSIVYANTYSAERVPKATNMIVRIDNTQNGSHQIVKRKRNKDGNMVVSTSANLMDDDEPTPGFRVEPDAGLIQKASKLIESLNINTLADTANKFEQIVQSDPTNRYEEKASDEI